MPKHIIDSGNQSISGTLSANQLTITGDSAALSATLTSLGGGLSATGTGGLVLATSPTLVTPNIGAATGTSLKIPTIICDSGLLEIKDSTTWQNLRIFSTTDNGSNFEYFTIAQSGAAWKISGVRSGTGPTRQLQIQPSGTLQLGANGGDGWTINASKHLYPDGTTQSRDLGLVGNRIRTLYGQNADLTGNLTASGTVSAANVKSAKFQTTGPLDDANTSIILSNTDNGTIKNCTSSLSSISIEVPSDLEDGFNIMVIQSGTDQITFTAGAGTTLNSFGGALTTAGQHAVATLVKTAAGTYNVGGNLV